LSFWRGEVPETAILFNHLLRNEYYSNNGQEKELNLEIINRVKNGKSQASLFHRGGFSEGRVHIWIKEEDKLHSFVDSKEEEIGLQGKKMRLCETVT
jgi:hypothetical protein